MATLQFKGKNIIWNHHMSVPYHTLDLDEKLSYKQDKADGNLIIEGDNLPALKSLLPQYTGKIKCIYIDPPYNTGNEKWIYNDNVNNSMIKEWIGKVVDKNDLTKHDKWLCMITPRIKLLRDLLSKNGIIFISIDDNEVHHLKTLFLENGFNFVAQLVWKGKSGAEDDTYFRTVHEYILVFSRDDYSFVAGEEEKTDEKFPYTDESSGKKYKTQLLRKWGSNSKRADRPNLYYPIKTPEGEDFYPMLSKEVEGCWRWGKPAMKKAIEDGRIEFKVNSKSILEAYEKVFEPEEGEIRTKKFQSLLDDVGTTSNGTKELASLLPNESFDHPKPSTLIRRLLQMGNTEENDLILDAFAGSGTTAQAVLELNEEDEGNRKFILIQMPENSEKEPKKNIARDITRERVKKVIEKKLKNKDIGFEYRRVGQPIDAETILSGQLPKYKQLAKYVYYLATGQSPKDKDIDEKKFLAGKIDHTEVYLLYTPDMDELKKMAITFEWAKEISKGNDKKKIVYAPACFMDDEYLEQFNIKFVSIPYNLFEREK